MMTLTEARDHVGAGVVYRPVDQDGYVRGALAEDGTIVRVNDTYVFVLYAGDRVPKATHPNHLTLLVSQRT